ncbi:Hypothetical predicted protein, partial [Olea europaea subsp. europaea]
ALELYPLGYQNPVECHLEEHFSIEHYVPNYPLGVPSQSIVAFSVSFIPVAFFGKFFQHPDQVRKDQNFSNEACTTKDLRKSKLKVNYTINI